MGESGKFMLQLGGNIYVGEYRRNADEKCRVSLPSKWRFGANQNEIYVAIPNPSGCITVYPPKMVEKLQEKASEVSLGDKKGQKILTKLFSKADQLACDSQGRIALNSMLWTHACLEKEILIVGSFVTFSVWDPVKYGEYMGSDLEEDDEISKILTQLGL
jgi:MraZ protein